MSITRHHNEWLSLVPNSGPFLSLPVLTQAFPQGLDAHDAEHARRLRLALDEWDDDQTSRRPDPAIHRAWIKFVLGETLGYDELLAEGQEIPQTLKSDLAEYGETLRPDWIVNGPATKKARLLVQVYPRSQSLTKPVASSQWKTSPDTRMMQLLHDTGIRLGIVTNGFDWMLVNAPKNETTGYASWRADLWQDEPITLRAFRTILGADRLFSVSDDETLEALLDKSAADQQEVTDQLGYQVRRAVEVLIQALDKADEDHGRKLLKDLDEKVLYEAALTVMMRLVFLFCAEERELLLLGDDLYDKNYAVSTLREQLEVAKSEHTEEILGLRFDAWPRLLTTFRAVYAGVAHDRLNLPAYGGSLFDPDRFPFLEGRRVSTSWKDQEATPLPVSNRTVLHLLDALQVLQTKVGKSIEARKLSFRALDIEQIGHVYEGLLDHTAKRATEPMLGLAGTRDKEPEVALGDLEKLAAKDAKELLKYLKDETGRTESALKKALNAELDAQVENRFHTACQDFDLWERVKRFAGLVRLDTVGYPVVILPGSIFVTAGTDRRSSGTHYTPKSLTEPIVQYTLEPLVYIGPAEGLPKEQWKLRPARELLELKICDMACGSGAFLVQACRYMAARLLEAWDQIERQAQSGTQQSFLQATGESNTALVRITPYGDPSKGGLFEQVVPLDPDERQTYALRIVAQRCLYGVDRNPLAAEMAKLSLWLLTLAKDKPFEFLDHAIRYGDSLVGIHNVDQLRKFNLDGKGEDNRLFLHFLDEKIKEAVALRRQIMGMQANTAEDVEAQDRMLREANEKIDRLKCAADMLISAEFVPGSAADKRAARDDAAIKVAVHFNDSDLAIFREEANRALDGQVTFHWPLEFPEVMVERGGFDAFVGNPPFMGGLKIVEHCGPLYRPYLVAHVAHGHSATADLCAYFFLRAFWLLRGNACLGLLATNTIAQGDTREVGLEQMAQHGATFQRAIPSKPWPGMASIEVAHVWAVRGEWSGSRYLGDRKVEIITALLSDVATGGLMPYQLKANADIAVQGCNVLGLGFTMTPEEATALIARNNRNRDVLFPYLNGEELNSDPQQQPSRWVIYFRNWPLDKVSAAADHHGPVAADYPDCLMIVEQKVKPERAKNNDRRRREIWWQFTRPTVEVFDRLACMKGAFARSRVSNLNSIAWVPTGTICSEAVVIFLSESFGLFAIVQSMAHTEWLNQFASSMRTDVRYTPSDCFDTFPLPTESVNLVAIGEKYFNYRQSLMITRQEGLTRTYNRFHDSHEVSADIQKLRQLHVEMDYTVAAAYGWADLALGHGFHETKQGVRYTISEAARREVLACLLKLNHERYAQEVKQGLHEQKKMKPALKPKATGVRVAATLFSDDATFPSTEQESYLCGLVCDLVKADPGLPVSAYVDSLVIALGHERHKRLLSGKDRTDFVKRCQATPLASWSTSDRIPWAELKNLLTQRKAIELDGQAFQVGPALSEVRNSYLAATPGLIVLLRKAAAELRGLQSQADPQKADILQAFVADKQQWFGVAA